MENKEFNLSERARKITNKLDVYKSHDIKEFIKWCEKHSHISEGVRVIDIEKLKEGAGEKLK